MLLDYARRPANRPSYAAAFTPALTDPERETPAIVAGPEGKAAIKRYNIDCDYERTGVIDIATSNHSPNYLTELRDDYQQLRSLGQNVEWLDRDAMHAQVHSPTYTGG